MNVTDNIRTAFKELGERVHRTLHVQRGDVSRMETQRDNVRLFLQDIERVCISSITIE